MNRGNRPVVGRVTVAVLALFHGREGDLAVRSRLSWPLGPYIRFDNHAINQFPTQPLAHHHGFISREIQHG